MSTPKEVRLLQIEYMREILEMIPKWDAELADNGPATPDSEGKTNYLQMSVMERGWIPGKIRMFTQLAPLWEKDCHE